MKTTHIRIEEPIERDSSVELAATLESGDLKERLWYSFPGELAGKLCSNADPFLIGTIFRAMELGHPVKIYGTISPSLLVSLHEFQLAWSSWQPEKWHPVEIEADEERESEAAESPGGSIAAFTGGVDSSYSVLNHTRPRSAYGKRKIEAALFVHGFDIPLEDTTAFKNAARNARESLDTLGIELLTIRSNHKDLNIYWNETHGAGIISSLSFFKKTYGSAIVPSTYPYAHLSFPWGSNPVTDHLLSSAHFDVLHDGAGARRGEKLVTVSHWSQGYANLRVCFSAEEKDKNCCKCGKCTVNLLLMKALGLERPRSFPEDVSAESLSELRDIDTPHLEVLKSLVSADEQGIFKLPLRENVEKCIRANSQSNGASSTSKQVNEGTLAKLYNWLKAR